MFIEIGEIKATLNPINKIARFLLLYSRERISMPTVKAVSNILHLRHEPIL
jgi:hypothetical protein